MTTKTVVAVGTAIGLAFVTWTVCAPADLEQATAPGSLPENPARPSSVRFDQSAPPATERHEHEDGDLRDGDEKQFLADADQAPPTELDEARARLERITVKMREARHDLSSMTNEERQALFAEGMAAYDSMRAQASLAGPEAKAELDALYPEFRELMLAVKPPPPGAREPEPDGG